MKKIISTVFILSVIVINSFSQGFYFGMGLGYAFPNAGQSMYDTPIPYNGFPTGYNGTRNNTTNTETYSIKGASFSSGFQGVLRLGYMFSENVGVQLDGGIGLSNTKYTFNDYNVNLNTGSGTIPYDINTTQHANTPLILMPSLVLETGSAVKIYSRLGLVLPLSSKVTQEQVLTNAPGTGTLQVDDFTWQIKSGFSLGFTAAAGLKYQVNDKVSIWGELSILSMSLYTKEQDLKSWTENGQSVPLSNYSGAQNIKFSKTATLDSNLADLPTYAQPFSNVGINVGVTFNLSNGNNRHSGWKHNDEDIEPSKPFRRR